MNQLPRLPTAPLVVPLPEGLTAELFLTGDLETAVAGLLVPLDTEPVDTDEFLLVDCEGLLALGAACWGLDT